MNNNYRINLKRLVLDAVLILLAYGIFYREMIGGDTVFHRFVPLGNIETWMTSGRYMAYITSIIPFKMGFVVTEHYKLCYFLFLALIIVSLYIIQGIFLPLFKNIKEGTVRYYFLILVTSMIFINVFFTEYFYFSMCFFMFPFAYLFAVLGVLFWTKRSFPAAILCLAVSCMYYQVCIMTAAVLIGTYYVLEADLKLDAGLIRREIIMSAAVGILGVLDILSSSILYRLGITDQVQKDISLAPYSSLQRAAAQCKELLTSSLQLLPPARLPLLMIVLAIAVSVFGLIRRKRKGEFIVYILFLVFLCGMTFALPAAQGGYFYPRVIVLFYASVSMLVLCAFYLCPEAKIENILMGCFSAFMLIQVIFIQVIASNGYVSKELDRNYAAMVIEKIDQYEAENDIKLKHIAITFDPVCLTTYDQVHFKRDQINERVMCVTPYSMLYYMYMEDHDINEIFDRIDMPEEKKELYFKDRNWDHIDLPSSSYLKGKMHIFAYTDEDVTV